MSTRVPLTIHVNGETKTVGSAVVEAPNGPFPPIKVTATVNDAATAEAIIGDTLKHVSLTPHPAPILETHTQATMAKVYASLHRAGMSDSAARDAVNEMQNHGILFRERV